MSKTEILELLPKLDPAALREIRDRIWQIEEEELLSGRAEPTDQEKELLDAELDDYPRNSDPGSTWEEVEARLKK